ncbi:MAG TPA: PKD domain-containing protein, partial [Candidatus Thermoplasmatota archaeon]|nr:PKD domain-containing protein [Candidatus Thermoplasmatota archaeon]
KKRVICIGMMLVLTAFVGITTNVSAGGLPPVADAGGPYTGVECDSMLLDASGSYDPDGDPLTYRWFIDGSWYDSAGPNYDWIWMDDFTGVITLEVSDGDLTDTDTADVTVSNVPPVINSTVGPTEVELGTEVPLAVNFFDGLFDPRGFIASLDTYTATFYWDDGTTTTLVLGVEEFWANASHMYTEPGLYFIIIAIIDDNGGEADAIWEVSVNLKFVDAGQDAFINEGSMFVSSGFLADDSGTYTAQVDYDDGTGMQALVLNPGNSFDLSHQYGDNGVYSVVVTAFTEDGEDLGYDSATVTVYNVAPTIESLIGSSADPVQLGTPILLNGVFSDPGYLDTHIATIDWGDGQTTSVNVPFGSHEVAGSHLYASAGVYQITLTVTDDDGGSDSETLQYYVVIYDPSAGFVTGGGWIIAQPGSYPANPSLTGKATFGFVSKYKKGQNQPEGNTEFQFHAAGMNFHSHTYEWLVVAGSKAMYKGVGTINGAGNYGFKIIVIDGQKNGGGGIDKFRMKIWDLDNNDAIVFDNNLGLSDDENPVTALSGGQITIHKN